MITSTAPTSIGSPFWTIRRFVSEVRILLNELDNERIGDINIRHHANAAISSLVESLAPSQHPMYAWSFTGVIDTWNAGAGLPSLLGLQPFASQIWKVKDVIAPFYGPAKELDIRKLYGVATGNNTTYDKSIAWAQQGSQLLLHVGRWLIANNNEPQYLDAAQAYVTPPEFPVGAPTQFVINVVRHPLLDDCLPPAMSLTWNQPIDVPERHIRNLLLMVQKMCLEQINKLIPLDVEQVVTAMPQAQNATTQQTTMVQNLPPNEPIGMPS